MLRWDTSLGRKRTVGKAGILLGSALVAWLITRGQPSSQRLLLFIGTLVAIWQLWIAVFQFGIAEKQDEQLSRLPALSLEATVSQDAQGKRIEFSVRNKGLGWLAEGEGYFKIFLELAPSQVQNFMSGSGNCPYEVLPDFQTVNLSNGRTATGIIYRDKIPGAVFPDRILSIGTCFLRAGTVGVKLNAEYSLSTRYGVFPLPQHRGELQIQI